MTSSSSLLSLFPSLVRGGLLPSRAAASSLSHALPSAFNRGVFTATARCYTLPRASLAQHLKPFSALPPQSIPVVNSRAFWSKPTSSAPFIFSSNVLAGGQLHRTLNPLSSTTSSTTVVQRAKSGVAVELGSEGTAGKHEEQKSTLVECTAEPQSNSDTAIGLWLVFVCLLVAFMVWLGGVTRLTGSGLSMVKWKPLSLSPPWTDEEWAVEFEEFKKYPEYLKKRQYEDFGVQDFKFIYFMEWSHRIAGRVVGVAFTLPFLYFAARGNIQPSLRNTLGGLLCLGGAQGFVGWWMVSSGLRQDKMDETTAEHWQLNTQFAHVSPYRLTAHLSSALVIYSLLLWTGLGLMDKRRIASTYQQTASSMRKLWGMAHGAAGFAALTAFSGGFVAGNHAGLANNDWPWMNGRFIPDDLWEPEMGWKNLTENLSTVQFDHRILAYSTLAFHLMALVQSRAVPLPPRARFAFHLASAAVVAQMSLGVATLWGGVPLFEAASHQTGSVLVLSSFIWLLHTLRAAHPGYRLASAAQAAAKGVR